MRNGHKNRKPAKPRKSSIRREPSQDQCLYSFAVAPAHAGRGNFVDQMRGGANCCEKMLSDYYQMLEAIDIHLIEDAIRWGLCQYQYVGGGKIIAIDGEAALVAYQEALRISATVVSDDGQLSGARPPRIDKEAKNRFRRAFRSSFFDLVSANRASVDSLVGAKLMYADSTTVVVDGRLHEAKIQWLDSKSSHLVCFSLTEGLSFEGLLAAFELFMEDGTISPRYSAPLIMRYELDKGLIPPDELNMLLEHDLGL